MDLIKDYCVGRLQPRVREQAAQQDARRDKLNQRSGAGLAFAADGVPDAVPHTAAVQRGKAAGCRAGSHPPRLGDHNMRLTAPPLGLACNLTGGDSGDEVGEERRDQRGLTRSGRRLNHCCPRRTSRPQRCGKLPQRLGKNEACTDGCKIEGHPSIVPAIAVADPGRTPS